MAVVSELLLFKKSLFKILYSKVTLCLCSPVLMMSLRLCLMTKFLEFKIALAFPSL